MKLVSPFLILTLFVFTIQAQEIDSGKGFITTVWSQKDSSYKNFRIPALIVTQQNTLLAFAEGREAGDTGNIDLLVKRSQDGGKTWSEQSVVWDDGENTCGNPTPVIDRETGRILLLTTWNLGQDHESDIIKGRSKSRRIPFLIYSDDDGKTWSKPRSLAATAIGENWGWYATGPGIAIQLRSDRYRNRIVVPCNHSYDAAEVEKRNGKGYGAHVLFSDNGGKSWKRSEQILPEVNESQIVELANGTLQMNMRSYNGNSFRAFSRSQDGGETWSPISFDSTLVEPVCQASLIDYGKFEDENVFLFSNPSSNTSRVNMTIKVSTDQMIKWKYEKTIYQGPSAYSCLAKLPNGNIGLFFEAGIESPYERMIFVSIHPDELQKSGSFIKDLKY